MIGDTKPKLPASQCVETKTQWSGLPDELKFAVLKHVASPVDLFSLSQTNRSNRHLIADEFQIWNQHGVTRPVAPLSTMQQAWASRVGTLGRDLISALSQLVRPLDVFSEFALHRFSYLIRAMNHSMAHVVGAIEQKDAYEIFDCFTEAQRLAENAGVDLPRLPEEARPVCLEHIDILMDDAESYALHNNITSMRSSLYMAEAMAKMLDIEKPLLSADLTMSCHLHAMNRSLELAGISGRQGDIYQMTKKLKIAARCAQQGNIELPSLSLQDMSQETISSYLETIDGLRVGIKNGKP